jgi:hypothetical protein
MAYVVSPRRQRQEEGDEGEVGDKERRAGTAHLAGGGLLQVAGR